MKHRTTVIQTTEQKQTQIDTGTDWCTKDRQQREGRELDVTRTKDVTCTGQRGSRKSPDFLLSPGELRNPFSFSFAKKRPGQETTPFLKPIFSLFNYFLNILPMFTNFQSFINKIPLLKKGLHTSSIKSRQFLRSFFLTCVPRVLRDSLRPLKTIHVYLMLAP